MTVSALDDVRMRQALALASLSIGLTDPNPRVGCVIGDAHGRVLGQGATQEAGAAHAEVMALRDVRANGHSPAGATAWVTLEPCAHHGRTPPCCDALIEAGIARCVVAMEDPFPQVAGAGLARLKAAGIQVSVLETPDIIREARELNIGFFSRIERRRPWVRMKAAISLDGRSALADGRSQWITGPAARADGHRWRKRASAILTGVGTVLADNPRLDVRLVETARQPRRVIVDSTLRTPLSAAILQPPGEACIVSRAGFEKTADRLRQQGATVWDDWPDGQMPTLPALLQRLADSGVNELHVEAGPRLNGSLLCEDLVDELLVYVAAKLIGPGRAMADLPSLDELAQAKQFAIHEVRAMDAQDLCLRLRRPEARTAHLTQPSDR